MYKNIIYICIMAGKKDIVITNVPDSTRILIDTIVQNLGVTRSQYLKSKIRLLIDAEPQHLKNKQEEF
jgi:hypothetical protein